MSTTRSLANPAPLGLAGFAMTTWLLSMINAGWYPATGMAVVLAMAAAFGGTAQFAAGLCELPRGNTFGFVAFCGFGSFWWSFALFVGVFAHPGDAGGHGRLVPGDLGRLHAVHVVRDVCRQSRGADGVLSALDHLLPAGGGRVDRQRGVRCTWRVATRGC